MMSRHENFSYCKEFCGKEWPSHVCIKFPNYKGEKKLLRKCEKEKSTRKEKLFCSDVVTKFLSPLSKDDDTVNMFTFSNYIHTHTHSWLSTEANQFHCFSLILHEFDGTHSLIVFCIDRRN